MKLIGTLLIFGLVACSSTPVKTTNVREYRIPEESSLNGPEAVLLKDLPEETLIKGDGFSFTAPKGWTIRIAGPDRNFYVAASAYPSATITRDISSFDLSLPRVPIDLSKIVSTRTAKSNKVEKIKLGDHEGFRFESAGSGAYVHGFKSFGFGIKGKRDISASGTAKAGNTEEIRILDKILETVKVD